MCGRGAGAGGLDIPVTVQIQINGQFFEPFGPHNMPLDGDVNDGMNPRHFIIQEVFNPSNRITVTGSGWLMKKTPTAQRTTATGSI